MELYYVKDQVQESVDYNNSHERESLIIGEITKPTLIFSINESIPEKYFKSLNCETVTTTRKAYTIATAKKDIVINYKGPRRKELKDFIMSYIGGVEKRGAIRDNEGNKSMVFAPIKNGIEFAIYNENQFYCNYEKLNKEFNEKRKPARVNAKDLVSKLEEKFQTKSLNQLPKERKHIKNLRGILKACNTGKNIFEVKKKIKRVKTPMVFDEIQNANVPKTSLLGFGCLNHTTIKDGYYYGDLTIFYQDNEFKKTIKFLEEKGGIIWVG